MVQNSDIDDRQLDDLQRAAFGYFPTFTNGENGLVADTSLPDWPCSIAAVGFALSCYPVAVSRGWIERALARQIVLATLRFFDNAPLRLADDAICHRGFFFHFLDMKRGRRAWRSELSFMDTAILVAGMLAVSRFFDGNDRAELEIRERAQSIYRRVDWRWAQDRHGRLRLGWKPHRFLAGHWTGFSEILLLWILGLGSETFPLDPTGYRSWLAGCDWLDRPSGGFIYAGPLFIHLFPQAWLDLRGVQDPLTAQHGIDYFENTRRAIAAHRAYGEENPYGFTGYGADLWGMTACMGPKLRTKLANGRRATVRGYAARGAPFGPDDGTVAPWASLACLPHAPNEAWRALRHLLRVYPDVLRDGRFADAFNPSLPGPSATGWVAQRCTGIDQGLLVLAIENFRSGLPWELMRRAPNVVQGLRVAGFTGGWLSA